MNPETIRHGINPQAYGFITEVSKKFASARAEGLPETSLDVFRRNLVGIYCLTPVTLKELVPFIAVGTAEAVRYNVAEGIKVLHSEMPIEAQEKYPLSEVLKLKPRGRVVGKKDRLKVIPSPKHETEVRKVVFN